MPNSWGEVGVSISKTKDLHGCDCVRDFCIFTVNSPPGCSFEIIVSNVPFSSKTRTFCTSEGSGGKRFARMKTLKWSGRELASKMTVACWPFDQTPHCSRENQWPARITPECSVLDNIFTEPISTASMPARSSAAEPSLDRTNSRGRLGALATTEASKVKSNPENRAESAPRCLTTSGRGSLLAPQPRN